MFSDPVMRRWLRYAISIGSTPHSPSPRGLKQLRRPYIRLEFDDIEVARNRFGYVGSTEEDVRKIVTFSRRIKDDPGPTLVHCAAGISRSSAASLILLAILLGPGQETEAVGHVLDVVEWCGESGLREVGTGIRPNRRIVWLGDTLLGLGGALLRATTSHPGLRGAYGEEWPPWTP